MHFLINNEISFHRIVCIHNYILILIKYGCIYRYWLVSVHISLDPYKVWMHLQTLVGFCTSLLILIKYGCIYRHWLVSVHLS